MHFISSEIRERTYQKIFYKQSTKWSCINYNKFIVNKLQCVHFLIFFQMIDLHSNAAIVLKDEKIKREYRSRSHVYFMTHLCIHCSDFAILKQFFFSFLVYVPGHNGWSSESRSLRLQKPLELPITFSL